MNNEKNLPNILTVEPTNVQLSIGKLLVSEPFLSDIYFRRSVILLVDYSVEGALGIVLNKPTFIKFPDFDENFNNINLPIYSGGPVDIENFYFMHKINKKFIRSEKILPNIFWSSYQEEIINYISSKELDTNSIRAFLGYSSWEPNQLEEEIKRGSWIVCNTNVKQVFETNPIFLWKEVVKNLGEKYKHWLNFPENYMLN